MLRREAEAQGAGPDRRDRGGGESPWRQPAAHGPHAPPPRRRCGTGRGATRPARAGSRGPGARGACRGRSACGSASSSPRRGARPACVRCARRRRGRRGARSSAAGAGTGGGCGGTWSISCGPGPGRCGRPTTPIRRRRSTVGCATCCACATSRRAGSSRRSPSSMPTRPPRPGSSTRYCTSTARRWSSRPTTAATSRGRCPPSSSDGKRRISCRRPRRPDTMAPSRPASAPWRRLSQKVALADGRRGPLTSLDLETARHTANHREDGAGWRAALGHTAEERWRSRKPISGEDRAAFRTAVATALVDETAKLQQRRAAQAARTPTAAPRRTSCGSDDANAPPGSLPAPPRPPASTEPIGPPRPDAPHAERSSRSAHSRPGDTRICQPDSGRGARELSMWHSVRWRVAGFLCLSLVAGSQSSAASTPEPALRRNSRC